MYKVHGTVQTFLSVEPVAALPRQVMTGAGNLLGCQVGHVSACHLDHSLFGGDYFCVFQEGFLGNSFVFFFHVRGESWPRAV